MMHGNVLKDQSGVTEGTISSANTNILVSFVFVFFVFYFSHLGTMVPHTLILTSRGSSAGGNYQQLTGIQSQNCAMNWTIQTAFIHSKIKTQTIQLMNWQRTGEFLLLHSPLKLNHGIEIQVLMSDWHWRCFTSLLVCCGTTTHILKHWIFCFCFFSTTTNEKPAADTHTYTHNQTPYSHWSPLIFASMPSWRRLSSVLMWQFFFSKKL